MSGSSTGLGYALYETVVPYKGINAKALKAITRCIVENRLQTTILRSDGEPATLELLTEIGRHLPDVKMQTAPQYSRQSQGIDTFTVCTTSCFMLHAGGPVEKLPTPAVPRLSLKQC
eukprot:5168360-Amphidinium_carterae.1